MPYLTHIQTLAGHSNFQRFEHFIVAVAHKKFRCSIVEKTRDIESLLDVLVRKPNGDYVAIEAKATQDHYANTPLHLSDLVTSWDPKMLLERLKKHQKKRGRGKVQAYLATTATIKQEHWKENRSKWGLDKFELWDAATLATFAASDWTIASFFPGLSEYTERYRTHSIDVLRRENSFRLGVALDEVIEEEEQATEPSPELGLNTLLFGPPYIGKTCWALRRAWRTCCKLAPSPSSVLWFNAINDSADDLTFLDQSLQPKGGSQTEDNENFVIVIDDIHFVPKENLPAWTGPVKTFVARRPGRVRVLWVARDESIAESLKVGDEKVCLSDFPIKQVTELFLKRLKFKPQGLCVVAALEAGLDPALGRAMMQWQGEGLEYPDLAKRIRNENNRRVGPRLLDIKSRLDPAAYSAYLVLVPFGSIAFPVEERFVAAMTGVDTAGFTSLAKSGVCSSQDGRLLLTEHPFQLRRTLACLDERGTESAAVQRFAHPDTRHPPSTLSEAVLCRYVQSSVGTTEALGKLNELNSHAEWAGVLDPMASAARHLVEATSNDDIRKAARKIAMKLSRTAYPRNEKVYLAALKKDLRWWEDLHTEANADEIYDGERLDYILYEEGYIHYLRERYADAATIFHAAVDAGFRAIDRALDPLKRNPQTLKRAQYALSNIWIAGYLERSAELRGHIYKALDSNASAATVEQALKQAVSLAKEIEATYQALHTASKSGADGLETGLPFFRAARAALRPKHQFPDYALTIDLTEPRFSDFIRRHQLNGWLHSFETASWPCLFGLEPQRVHKPHLPPLTDETFKKLAPLSDRNSQIGYRYKQVELLFRASGGEDLDEYAALQVAAMLRAAGSFEYLGDHLLLAWRTAKDADEKKAIAWFLKEQVPDVGFNGLPKLALEKLQLQHNK